MRDNKSKTTDGFRAHQFHLVRSERERNMPARIRKKRDEIEIEVIEGLAVIAKPRLLDSALDEPVLPPLEFVAHQG